MLTISFEELSEILNISIATARVEELRTPYAAIRPQLHTLLSGRIGSCKSSIIHEVCEQLGQIPEIGFKSATLMGSVDKNTGVCNLPAIWDKRNSVLAIDEFTVPRDGMDRSALSTLLSLLEKPKFSKRVGYRCNTINEKEKDLYCKIDQGKISVNTRFVFMANTMQNLHKKQRMIELEALRSRCLVVPYYPSLDDLKKIANGRKIYKFKNFKAKKKVKIDQKSYKKLLILMENYQISPENYLRTLGDLCRVFSIKKYDLPTLKLILSLKSTTREVYIV